MLVVVCHLCRSLLTSEGACRCDRPLAVGDRVLCRCPGSWGDGMQGFITRLNVAQTSAGVWGHELRIAGIGLAVFGDHELTRVAGEEDCDTPFVVEG